MAASRPFTLISRAMRGALYAASLFLVFGCSGGDGGGEPAGGGGGGGGGGGAGQTRQIELSAGGSITDVLLPAGQTTNFVFDSTQASTQGPFEGITLRLADNVPFVTVANPAAPRDSAGRQASLSAGATAQVFIRVSSSEDTGTVCETGYLYGLVTVSVGAGPQPTAVDPAELTATPATVNVVNNGLFSVCVGVIPSEDMMLTVDNASVEVTDCEEEPANIAGTWTGPFTCTQSCGDTISDTVTLTITQNGPNATYTDDGGGYFRGTVCGNRFTFSGGYNCLFSLCSEVESGTFTLTGANTAAKTSHFSAQEGLPCQGDCQDSLTRVSP